MNQQETATGTFASGPLDRTQDTGDPRCCQFQENNLDDRAFITQKTDQTASPPIDDQFATLQGDCDTTGLCILDQSATTDYDHKTNSDSGMILHEGIECFGAGEEGGCEVVGFGD